MCRQVQRFSCGHNHTVQVKCIHELFNPSHILRRPNAKPCTFLVQREEQARVPCRPCAGISGGSSLTPLSQVTPVMSSTNLSSPLSSQSAPGRLAGSKILAWVEDQQQNHPPEVGSNKAPTIRRQRDRRPPPARTSTSPEVIEIAHKHKKRARSPRRFNSANAGSSKSPRSRMKRARTSEDRRHILRACTAEDHLREPLEISADAYEVPRRAPVPPAEDLSAAPGEPNLSYADHLQAKTSTKASPPRHVDTGKANTWMRREQPSGKTLTGQSPKSKDKSPGILVGLFSSKSKAVVRTPTSSSRPSTAESFRDGLKHLGESFHRLYSFGKVPDDDESFVCITSRQQEREGEEAARARAAELSRQSKLAKQPQLTRHLQRGPTILV